jgi:pimeloyl-ACP methyl ester carboxylesterase
LCFEPPGGASSVSTMAAAVPNGKAEVVPGAAHLAHLENAEAVHQALRGFLAPLS